MAKLSDDDVIAICRYEVEQAQGYDSDVLATKREKALQYYHGFMPDPGDGRSSIVSTDVRDTVHALLSQVEPIFQSSVIQFQPESEQDESSAQMESDYVRKVFDSSNGWENMYEAAHDALLIGNGWLKTVVDQETEAEEEVYPLDIDDAQRDAIMQPKREGETVTVKQGKDRWTVTRTVTRQFIDIKCIAPDDILFTEDAGQFKIEDLRMVGERVLYTVNDLIEMGLTEDEAKTIPDSADDYWPAQRARQGIYQNDLSDNKGAQDAEQLKECYDLYIRLDMNGDGQTERYNVLYGGSEMIRKDMVYCHPFTTGSPVPMPHRVQGTGCFELFKEVQDAKTNVLRSYVDNLEVMNSSRVGAVEGDVNMADLTSARINGVVRMKHANAVVPFPATDIGGQAITGLNYLDTVRTQRGGATLDMNESDRQLMKSSAAAATGQMESAEAMAGWYARNLTNTILADTFKLIHKKLRKELKGRTMANLRGQWVEVDPAQWPDRRVIEVLTGMTTKERNNKISGLNQVIQQQTAIMQMGGQGVLTDMNKVYASMSDWIRAADLGQPEEYLIDPQSQQAQQAAQQNSEQAQKQQEQIDRIAAMESQLEQQKLELDKYKHDTELRYKYYDTDKDAEMKETEMTVDNITKLNIANAKSDSGTSETATGTGGE